MSRSFTYLSVKLTSLSMIDDMFVVFVSMDHREAVAVPC